MIVKVLEALDRSEVYCEIISGNPNPSMYPTRVVLDPYICQLTTEPTEQLVGRVFDLGDLWTVYTILPRKFEEVTEPLFEQTSCSQCGQEFGPGNHGYSHCEDHQHIDSSEQAQSAEIEPQEILAQAPESLLKDCCSISLDDVNEKREEIAFMFNLPSYSPEVEAKLYRWIEGELEKRGLDR